MPPTDAQVIAAVAGRYEVDREIGRGGMATVYLARDVKHHRNVALKVLDPELGAVLGVDRFLSEISVTANLQHPNLLPLYDSGESNGLLYYVMPYIEGEGLRDRLNREKQLPVDDAVRIAAAIASALDYAHKHGVIHRDLKPENILLQHGQPFVADFGIALAVTNAGGNRITQTGLSLGTPQYMSPEQATGERVVDGRTDIYSLGCVLYETLAGEAPFVGGTSQAVIAKMLSDKPRDVRELRDRVPEQVALVIDRALAKIPADRFATAGDMHDALIGRSTLVATPARKLRARSREPRAWLPWVVAAVAVAAAGMFAVKSASQSAVAVRFPILLPNASLIDAFALSRDGKTLAYSANTGASKQLVVRSLDQLEARPLPGTEGADHPVWSPSGTWIAFSANGQLLKTQVAGGPVQVVAPFGFGYDWVDDETMIVGSSLTGTGLRRSTRSAPLAPITRLALDSGEMWHVYPLVLLKHKVAFVVWGVGGLEDDYLAVGDLETGKYVESKLVAITTVAYQDGWLIYQDPERRLMATRVDLGNMTIDATPVLLQSNVVSATLTPHGAVTLVGQRTTGIYRVPLGSSVGASATPSPMQSAFKSSGSSAAQSAVKSAGQSDVGSLVLESDGILTGVRLSPQHDRIVYIVQRGDSSQLFVHDLRTRTAVRLWTGFGVKDPEWLPDGRSIVFSEGAPRLGFWRIAADGGVPTVIVSKGYPRHGAVSPDGRSLVYVVNVAAGSNQRAYNIWQASLVGDAAPHSIVAERDGKSMPSISPNGRWLAYDSNENSRDEVYVRSFTGAPGQWRVSLEGGMEPRWSRDGKRLFYRAGGDVIAATLRETASGIEIVSRAQVAHFALSSLSPWDPMYDVSGPNELLVASANEKGWQLLYAQDWLSDLRRAVKR